MPVTQDLPGTPAKPEASQSKVPVFIVGTGVIQRVEVEMIFWGKAWEDPTTTPAVSQVIDDATEILTGPYMKALKQYSDIGPGVLIGTRIVNTEIGHSPAEPPNPFSRITIKNLIVDLIDAGRVPHPNNQQILYCVILPFGIQSSIVDLEAEHNFDSLGGVNYHFAWITNDGTRASLSTLFSHELVEAVSNPENMGVRGAPGTCKGSGWCEIADVCPDTAVVNNVTVQKYWSIIDHSCVAPTD